MRQVRTKLAYLIAPWLHIKEYEAYTEGMREAIRLRDEVTIQRDAELGTAIAQAVAAGNLGVRSSAASHTNGSPRY